jgi:hypothetical protein
LSRRSETAGDGGGVDAASGQGYQRQPQEHRRRIGHHHDRTALWFIACLLDEPMWSAWKAA